VPHRQLKDVGIDNIVFNAADLKKSQKEHVRKTDAVDCKAIWENLKKGDLKAIYVPTEQEEHDRELIRGREIVVVERLTVQTYPTISEYSYSCANISKFAMRMILAINLFSGAFFFNKE